MSSVSSNANSKTWMPLLDCFVNKLLIANCPLPPAAMLPFHGDVCVVSCNNLSLLSLKNSMMLLAHYPSSCPNTLIKTLSFAENTMFIVHMIASKQRH